MRGKSLKGAASDKLQIAQAYNNKAYKDLDIAIIKATNHDVVPPKEKHVRTIFNALSGAGPRADVQYTIAQLVKRMRSTTDWIVVLKTLIVIHRALREVDPSFQETLLHSSPTSSYLNMGNYADNSHPEAWDYSAWIRIYSQYLEEKVETIRAIRYDIEVEGGKDHSRTRALDTEEMLVWLPRLQAQMSKLVNCRAEGASTRNIVTLTALALVVKESFKLYRAINDGIINLVDKFFEMERSDAIQALEIYRTAGKQAERLQAFYDSARAVDAAGTAQFPQLEQPPASFLQTMEEYVKESPGGPIEPVRSSSRTAIRAQSNAKATHQNLAAGHRPVEEMASRRLAITAGGEEGTSAPTTNGTTAAAAPPPPAAAQSFDLLDFGDTPAQAPQQTDPLAASSAAPFGFDSTPHQQTFDAFGEAPAFGSPATAFSQQQQPQSNHPVDGFLALPAPPTAEPAPQANKSTVLDTNYLSSLYSSGPLVPSGPVYGGGNFGMGAAPPPPQGFGGPGFGGPAPGFGGPSSGYGAPPLMLPPSSGFGGVPPMQQPSGSFGGVPPTPQPSANLGGGYNLGPSQSASFGYNVRDSFAGLGTPQAPSLSASYSFNKPMAAPKPAQPPVSASYGANPFGPSPFGPATGPPTAGAPAPISAPADPFGDSFGAPAAPQPAAGPTSSNPFAF